MKREFALDRRSFLKSAGIAGTAALFAGGVSARTAEPFRVAVLGCGARGRMLVSALRGLGAEIVVAADPHADAPEGVPMVRDWRAAAETKGVEGVVVALPDHLHAPAALAALAAGKHVFIETPMAVNSRESAEIQAAARRAGKTVQVAAHAAADPAWRLALGLARAGEIGPAGWCHSVAAESTRGGAGADGWRWRGDCSPGPAARLHFEQAAAFAALTEGEPLRVSSASGRWNCACATPDSLISTLEYGNGVTLHLTSAPSNPTGNRPVIRGEKGCLEIYPDAVVLSRYDGVETRMPAPVLESPETVLLRDWMDAARTGAPTLCGADRGHAAVLAMEHSLTGAARTC